MSKLNSAPFILTLSLMNVFTVSAPAQMVGMVVHPSSQPRHPGSMVVAPRRIIGRQPIPVTVQVYPGARAINRNNRYGGDGRIFVRPPRSGDQLDTFVARMVIEHAQVLSCERLGNILRRLANDLLAAAQLPASAMPSERRGDNRYDMLRRNRERALHDTMRHPDFHKALLARLSETFKSCDKPCFDDGVAVGIISGSGYCSAAVAVNGLPADGFQSQERIPVCGTETFIGCQQGYTQAANTVAGCLEYASGANLAAFDDSISHDCHIDQP